MASVVNIVLVHGAWADGSSWSGIIPSLQKAGYNVWAVQLPLTGLDGDIAATERVLDKVEGPTLLVAHSYGGVVITAAGVNQPKVVGLVYIAAYAPDADETLLDINNRFAPTEGLSYIRPDSHGFAWLDPAGFLKAFAPDVEPVQAQIMAAVQKPNAGSAFGAKMEKVAWATLPSWYLVSENDQMVNPEAERSMAARMKATTRSVAASHVSMVSQPQVVIDLVLEATQSLATA